MHSPDPDLPRRFGPYLLRRLIGRGGMGEVYEAYDERRGRVVAIKVLPAHLAQDTSYVRRFQREAEIAASLSEPHVVPIHDFGSIDGALFIDMRLVEGNSLRGLLDTEHRLSTQRTVRIAAQVASALQAAHRCGLVHRDIKPDNVLLTDDDFVYLADFGIASRTGDERLTHAGTVVGSVDYMAPERVEGGESLPASDQYSLACLMFECVSGHPPFPVGSLPAKLHGHIAGAVPRLEAGLAPSPFADAIARGMSKRPADRYPTVQDLVSAAAVTPEQPIPLTDPPITPGPKRHRSTVAWLALLLVGVIIAGALWFRHSTNSPTLGNSPSADSSRSANSVRVAVDPSRSGHASATAATSPGSSRPSSTSSPSRTGPSSTPSAPDVPVSKGVAPVAATLGGPATPGIQAYANAVLADDRQLIVRRCWTYAPARIEIDLAHRAEILDAFKRNTSVSTTELGPGWGNGRYTVAFSQTEADSRFACPTINGPGIPGTTLADAKQFVKRLQARVSGHPVNPADTIGNYWLICDPFPDLSDADSRDTSSDGTYFTTAEKRAIATLASSELTLSGGTQLRAVGKATPVLSFGFHSVNLCLNNLTP